MSVVAITLIVRQLRKGKNDNCRIVRPLMADIWKAEMRCVGRFVAGQETADVRATKSPDDAFPHTDVVLELGCLPSVILYLMQQVIGPEFIG